MFDLASDLPPWDQGRLHAHQISAGPTEVIERHLERARRRRFGLLSWVLLGRRRYLDGLIEGLEQGLKIRERERYRIYASQNESTALGDDSSLS